MAFRHQGNPHLRRKRNLSKSKLTQRCVFTFLAICLILLIISAINIVVASHPTIHNNSADIMQYAKSASLKKSKNLDEHVKVTVTDNILQEQTIVGTTSKGQSKEESKTTIAADPSPRHLQKSSKSLERAKVCNAEGVIDELSYAVIAKIRRGIIEIQRLEQQQQQSKSKPRILCMVYTYEGAHASNLQAIVDTWAAQCDGFFAASNVTDVGLGAVDIKSMYFGPEAYGNMWNKVEAMWKYAYKHYLNDYDYFHICGDDAYVIPNNLRAYLMGEQVNNLLNGHLDNFSRLNGRARRWKKQRPRPLLLGFPVHFSRGQSYAAGGSGYTLNREAVKIFYEAVTNDPINITDSREDIIVADRYLAGFGITCSDTRDGSGAFRYLMDNPLKEYRDPVEDSRGGHKWFTSKVHAWALTGFDAFSDETVAIHLNYKIGTTWLNGFVNYTEEVMYRYHDFLNGKCDEELLSHLPNATKIKWLAFSQGRRAFLGPKTRHIVENVLGMPPDYLKDKRNRCQHISNVCS